jgi:hypothetical protein
MARMPTATMMFWMFWPSTMTTNSSSTSGGMARMVSTIMLRTVSVLPR